MQKQKNNISEKELLKKLNHLKNLEDKQILKPCPTYRVMERIYWLQNSVMSEAYNYYAFTSTLTPQKIVDLSPEYKGMPTKLSRYCIHHGTGKQRVLKVADVDSLIEQIKNKIKHYNRDKFSKYMYA